MEDVASKLVRVLVTLLLFVLREGSLVVGFVTACGHDEETALILLKSGAEFIQRSDFPKDMVFGVSSSAYQEDVGLMKDLQVDAYRFSISWSRLFPDGLGIKVNQEGVDYYNRLLNELAANGIQPCVTLWHWDLPQGLQAAFGGWHNPAIIQVFAHYAETNFREFGDRVKTWITANEPHEFLLDHGTLGCKDSTHSCRYRNPKDALYRMAHNVILSHTAAYQIYQFKYKPQQGGCIGITVDAQ